MADTTDQSPRVTYDTVQELKVEVERAIAAGELRLTLVPKLLGRGLPRDLVLSVVSEVEISSREARERRSNQLAMGVGAVACFSVCWIASLLLGVLEANEKIRELAGGAIGGLFGIMAKDLDLPGLRRGEFIGWVAYYVFLLIRWWALGSFNGL